MHIAPASDRDLFVMVAAAFHRCHLRHASVTWLQPHLCSFNHGSLRRLRPYVGIALAHIRVMFVRNTLRLKSPLLLQCSGASLQQSAPFFLCWHSYTVMLS